MSFDLGVWYPRKRVGNEEAGHLYACLCDGDTRGAQPHPAVDMFYAELTARHSEIHTVPEKKLDDHDFCPWSCKLDHSSGHVILSCVASKADFVHQVVQELARKHGLAMYDPQSGVVTYPDGSTGARNGHGAMWVLGFFGVLFAGIFAYTAQIAAPGTGQIFYVFAGLFGTGASQSAAVAWQGTLRVTLR
jgi:hypothetical protein